MRRIAILALAAGWLLLAAPAELSAFRCGHDLVMKGDRKIEVLKKCGEPDFVDEWEAIQPRHIFRFGHVYRSVEKVRIEEWTYNFGRSRFLQIYRFENGVVVDMEYGDYGF